MIRDAMKCNEIKQHLSAYLDAELDAALTEDVEKHVTGCEECQAELEALRKTRNLVAALPRVSAPGDFKRAVMNLARSGAEPSSTEIVKSKAKTQLLSMTTVLSLAAAIIAGLIVFLIFTPGENLVQEAAKREPRSQDMKKTPVPDAAMDKNRKNNTELAPLAGIASSGKDETTGKKLSTEKPGKGSGDFGYTWSDEEAETDPGNGRTQKNMDDVLESLDKERSAAPEPSNPAAEASPDEQDKSSNRKFENEPKELARKAPAPEKVKKTYKSERRKEADSPGEKSKKLEQNELEGTRTKEYVVVARNRTEAEAKIKILKRLYSTDEKQDADGKDNRSDFSELEEDETLLIFDLDPAELEDFQKKIYLLNTAAESFSEVREKEKKKQAPSKREETPQKERRPAATPEEDAGRPEATKRLPQDGNDSASGRETEKDKKESLRDRGKGTAGSTDSSKRIRVQVKVVIRNE